MVRISDSWVQKKDMSKDAANWDSRAETFNGPILSKDDPLISLIYGLADPNENTRVIDIGCGTGRVSMAFAKDV
jgi:ubiquinone/menaquinone biosynthesis C-methylase UbiE